MEVTRPVAFENESAPARNGLMDLRMGTVDWNLRCQTCAGDENQCPGHFGHVELAKPVIHIGFIKVILKVLRCICFHCAKLRINRDHPKFSAIAAVPEPNRRLDLFQDACRGVKRCGLSDRMEDGQGEMPLDGAVPGEAGGSATGCGFMQPKFKRDGVGSANRLRESGMILMRACCVRVVSHVRVVMPSALSLLHPFWLDGCRLLSFENATATTLQSILQP